MNRRQKNCLGSYE